MSYDTYLLRQHEKYCDGDEAYIYFEAELDNGKALLAEQCVLENCGCENKMCEIFICDRLTEIECEIDEIEKLTGIEREAF